MSKSLFTWSVPPCCAFIVALLLLLSTPVYCGDPCPQKAELAPCTCHQVDLFPERKFGIENSVTTSMTNQISGAKAGLPAPIRSLVKLNGTEKSEETTESPRRRTNSSYYTEVTCNAPKNQPVLEEAMTALHRKSLDKLVFFNVPPTKEHTLVRFPSGWLKNLRVKRLEIRNTMLSGDFIYYNNPFQGQEQSLVWFVASNCYLSGSLSYDTTGTVGTRGLNGLPGIQGLDLSKNNFVYIFAMAFKYPPANLTYLNLSYNSLQGMEGGVFNAIPNLKYMDLSHNLFEGMARTYFASPARYLEHIDLSWNHLTIMPSDFFENMPSLKIVNLSHNFLYSMPEKPWITAWRRLSFIDVTGNFIECDCSLMWLLPILSPPEVNSTTTPAPAPLPGQTIRGSCSQMMSQLFSRIHNLASLTRPQLNC